MALNIRQIEVFKAVMEAGSVTAAATYLGRSQPAVSKHLALLEDAMGVTLFLRTGNRLLPTDEAIYLFEQVERTYSGLDHLTRFASELRHSRKREISVAAMPLLARAWLADVIAPFTKRHDVSLSLPVRSSRWIIESVSAGRADIGIGLSPAGEDASVVKNKVMTLPLVCVLPRKHHLEKLDTVTPQDLEGETLISLSNFDHWRLTVEHTLDEYNVRPVRRIDSFTTYVACELASRDAGIAIVDSLTAVDYTGSELIWRPFAPELQFDIYLMRSRYRRLSPLTQVLLETLADEAAKTQVSIRSWIEAGPD